MDYNSQSKDPHCIGCPSSDQVVQPHTAFNDHDYFEQRKEQIDGHQQVIAADDRLNTCCFVIDRMQRSTNRANARGNTDPTDSHTDPANNCTNSTDGYDCANGNGRSPERPSAVEFC